MVVDQFEFFDDVLGSIHLSAVERDLVDAPEFQRLFRLEQLGLVGLVFRTANHTRGTHSIGACAWAKRLVDKLNENRYAADGPKPDSKVPRISSAERALIGIGALLHDIPHGPFSHDIEKKTHRIFPDGPSKKPVKVTSHYGLYEKHDDFASNPALYIALLDVETSILARVLRAYSPSFWELLLAEAPEHPHLQSFVATANEKWRAVKNEILPALLFHLSFFERPPQNDELLQPIKKSFAAGAPLSPWGLGPPEAARELHETWYQPFRHDIIGDTLSADLIDYLFRDQARLGMKNQLDLKLLNNYILVPAGGNKRKPLYRCAIDLNDRKRGTVRAERLNDIFRLLDLRHQIHEKAVYHRVAQSALAMLSRVGLALRDDKPAVAELYGYGNPGSAALAGDVHFLELLTKRSNSDHEAGLTDQAEEHQSIAFKIAERRVYRPLMVIPGDRIPALLRGHGSFEQPLEYTLRELAAIVDSKYYSKFFLLISLLIEKFLQHAIASEDDLKVMITELASDSQRLRKATSIIPKRVVLWTTPYKQLYKDPAILVCANDKIGTIEEMRHDQDITTALRNRVSAGIADAETKNEGLWKLYVFLSDGLFYTGSIAKLIADHPCQDDAQHADHLHAAQYILVVSLLFAWSYWQDMKESINLDQHMDDAVLATALQSFPQYSGWQAVRTRNLAQKVSGVNVALYLHGTDPGNCRDVRYKFDRERTLNEIVDDVVREPEKRLLVTAAFGSFGVATRDYFNGEELREVVCRLAAAEPALLTELADQPVAARNASPRASQVRGLWLTDLR